MEIANPRPASNVNDTHEAVEGDCASGMIDAKSSNNENKLT